MSTDHSAPDPAVSDVLAGASPAGIRTTIHAAVGAVLDTCVTLGLRPAGVAVDVRFGLLTVVVTFPAGRPADVDALADGYRLPPELPPVGPPPFLYERSGLVDLDQVPASLTASTTRPGVEPPSGGGTAAARRTEPRVITGEVAAVPPADPAALPAGRATAA